MLIMISPPLMPVHPKPFPCNAPLSGRTVSSWSRWALLKYLEVCILSPFAVVSWWSTTDLYRMKTVMEITFNWFYYRFSCLQIGTSKSSGLNKPSFIFRIVHARLWRCQPPRPASTVTPKSTWLPLTFSPARNSKISVHPHTTWRCQTSSVGTSKWVKIVSVLSYSAKLLSEALAQGWLFFS